MKNKENRGKRVRRSLSLSLMFSSVVFAVLLVTTLIVGLVVVYLIYEGMLQMGEKPLNTGTFLLSLVGLSVALGTILAFTSSRISLNPLDRVLDALDQLAEGDYSVRLKPKHRLIHRIPVFRDLIASFNTLAEELEKTEMLRSDFINNFSHEFKTPIVSIAGFVRLLRRGNLTEEKRQEYLAIIEAESLRLSQMATNVLNLTKIENQTILTDVEEVNLSEQLRVAMLMLEHKWSAKNLEPVLPSEEYFVQANAELMRQVWINLLDNAIKYSPEGGTIEAEIAQTKTSSKITTEIRITNAGDPIPEEKQAKLFNKFYQGDESHHAEGNGVGLAVVKKIIELHRGEVAVHCADGKITFTVTLTE